MRQKRAIPSMIYSILIHIQIRGKADIQAQMLHHVRINIVRRERESARPHGRSDPQTAK